MADRFTTSAKMSVTFKMPKLCKSATVQHRFAISNKPIGQYNLILGQDVLRDLGINSCFLDMTVQWPEKKCGGTNETVKLFDGQDILY